MSTATRLAVTAALCSAVLFPESAPAAGPDPPAAQQTALGEIIVTAEKREERLQDVPVALAVLDTTALTEANQTKLLDYADQIPNFNFAPNVISSTTLTIRGISTGGYDSSPTVAVLIDDAPYPSQDGGVAEIDPGDLTRIEVLRGPQGTLYGASSMGGLVKYVTKDPSTDKMSGRIEAGTSDVENGYSLGYSTRASINVPVTDQLALRASVFYRQDPGYLDNPVTHTRGLNEDHAAGGQLKIVWKALDALAVKVGAIYQDIRGDGTPDITTQSWLGNPVKGDLQQAYIRNVGQYERKTQFYDAVVTGKLGRVEITSVTSYNISNILDSFDASSVYGGLGGATGIQQAFPNVPGTTGAPVFDDRLDRTFTQELRVNVSLFNGLDGLLGAFYSHTYYGGERQTFLGTNPLTGAVAGVGYATAIPPAGGGIAIQRSLFSTLTYRLSDRIDVQGGGRYDTSINEGYGATFTGPYVPYFYGGTSQTFISSGYTSRSPSAVTYLVSPEFKVTPDFMAYARVASGFRPGGTNGFGPFPSQFQPDKTINYEVGTKGALLNNLVTFDVAAYDIHWKNIQLVLVTPDGAYYYTGNGGDASSRGLELSGAVRPLQGLTISSWIVFGDAKLTTIPLAAREAGTYAVPGDPLPGSSRFSSNVSVRQEFPVWSTVTGFAEAGVGYIGDRRGFFLGAAYPNYPGPRQDLPAYAKTNLRAGLRDDGWSAVLYVNNLSDRRGVASGGSGNPFPFSYYIITPRVVGLTLSRSF